ncbi:hypothetical protein MAHJHV59_49810 [Mycobacterium avium subsp. hominissuis]
MLDAVAAGVTPTDLRRLANTAVALGSLDLVGVGQAVLDRTVDYTKLSSLTDLLPGLFEPRCGADVAASWLEQTWEEIGE